MQKYLFQEYEGTQWTTVSSVNSDSLKDVQKYFKKWTKSCHVNTRIILETEFIVETSTTYQKNVQRKL